MGRANVNTFFNVGIVTKPSLIRLRATRLSATDARLTIGGYSWSVKVAPQLCNGGLCVPVSVYVLESDGSLLEIMLPDGSRDVLDIADLAPVVWTGPRPIDKEFK